MTPAGDYPQTVEFSLRRPEVPKANHYLTVVHGVSIRRAVAITPEPLVLGRDPSRPFFLPDADVSRSHCSVRLDGDAVLVRDLGSTNGTFVDGVRVEAEKSWPVASQLQVGHHTLKHELLRPDEVALHEEFASDLDRARRYVRALIPAPLSTGPWRTEWCLVESSELGGDALGYHELTGGRLAIYLIDVCGHGVASAMHTASVLNAVRSQSLPDTDFGEPSAVLERLNETFRMEDHGGMYFTLFYGVADPARGRLKYASAGHPPALVLTTGGAIRDRWATKNPPIGTMERRTFAQSEGAFGPGDRLCVFSDGVYEYADREGRDRSYEDFERELVAMAAPPPSDELVPAGGLAQGALARLYEAACANAGTDLLPDDFTMLLVEHATRSPH